MSKIAWSKRRLLNAFTNKKEEYFTIFQHSCAHKLNMKNYDLVNYLTQLDTHNCVGMYHNCSISKTPTRYFDAVANYEQYFSCKMQTSARCKVFGQDVDAVCGLLISEALISATRMGVCREVRVMVTEPYIIRNKDAIWKFIRTSLIFLLVKVAPPSTAHC